MKKSLMNELTRLRKAFDTIETDPMGDSAVRRMTQLEKMLQAEEKLGALNFTTRTVGEATDNGVIQLCPVCHEPGEKRESRLLRSTLFVHTLRVAPQLKDVIRIGNRYTDAGASGPLTIGEFHMVSRDGSPVMPAPKSSGARDVDLGWREFFNQHCDPHKRHQIVDLDLAPSSVVAKMEKKQAKAAPVVKIVPEWRKQAAAKAWLKIRANRLAAQQSAVAA